MPGRFIIPHFAKCPKPRCKLESLVLDLNWRQTRTLWQVEKSHPTFDKRLALGGGPA